MARRQKSSRRQRPEPEAVDVLPEGMELELEVQLDGDDPFAEEPEEEAPTEPEGLSSQHAEHMELSASSDVLTTPGVWLLAVLDSLVLSAGIVLIAAAIAEPALGIYFAVGGGFAMLSFSTFRVTVFMGQLTSISIFFALLIDLFLLPVLLLLIDRDPSGSQTEANSELNDERHERLNPSDRLLEPQH